jgi:hypothetical protein
LEKQFLHTVANLFFARLFAIVEAPIPEPGWYLLNEKCELHDPGANFVLLCPLAVYFLYANPFIYQKLPFGT